VDVTLADVHFVPFLTDVVCGGEVGLCLTVQEQVVAESWNGNIPRLDQSQMLTDELQRLSCLLQLLIKISLLILMVIKLHL